MVDNFIVEAQNNGERLLLVFGKQKYYDETYRIFEFVLQTEDLVQYLFWIYLRKLLF